MTIFIKDWHRVFGLREAAKHDEVTWTKFPVARGGLTYRRLMATAKGRTAYCVFVGCLRIAARERTNGALVFRGRDVTAQDLHDETGIPKPDCAAGFAYLQTAEVGWLTGSETVYRRFETGDESANERPKPSPRQEVEKEEEKEKKQKTKDTPPSAEIVRGKARGAAWGATFTNEIYAVVWKKVNRAAALKAIDKAGREITKRFDGDAARAFVWLKERTEMYARSNHVRTSEPRFIPHPATWFNKGGYDDDERVWAASNEPENVNETSFEKMLREQANAKATGGGSRGVFGETLSALEGHAGIVDPLGLSYRAIPGHFGTVAGDPRSAPN